MLYNQVMSLGGAEYFDESNCFVFCRVLLCCQKYGEAVLYLWRQRKALAAVHLAIVCLHYGLILPHRPLTYSPASPPAIAASISDPTPAALLRIYIAAPFLLDYPEQAVDYLVSLDSKWQVGIQGISEALLSAETLLFDAAKMAEFTTLLTTVGRAQLTKLVGSLTFEAASGTSKGANQIVGRGRGYLDRFMDSQDVSFLLAKAAHYLLTQARDSQGAVYAFQLAGRYEDAVEEMICQVGLVLVPPRTSLVGVSAGDGSSSVAAIAAREHWIHQCKSFHQAVLGSRQRLAPVLQRIGEAGGQSNRLETLSATLEIMIGLCAFVDACCQGRYRDALNGLDAMDFRFDDRLLIAFGDMHRTVQQSFDFVLQNAMDCVKQLFAEARRTGDVGREEADLRSRAGNIARFANAIPSFLQPHTASVLNKVQVGIV